MKVAVIGLGYVGLVTAACLAELGHEVLGIDIDSSRINMLKEGEMPIYEPGLRELVTKNNSEGRLIFTENFNEEVDKVKLIFLAVGTPSNSDGTPDLSAVYGSLNSLMPFIKSYKIFVLKSTVPIGTSSEIKKYISKKLKTDFDVVSNPEFLKEGTAVQDFMKPDRIIIGTENIKVAEIMRELYSHFTRNGHPILIMDLVSSEIVKYASNLMLALRVSFINEVALLCDFTHADVRRVREGVISDPRLGSQFLYPSLGFGGSCLPKDVQALSHFIDEKLIGLLIPKVTLLVNERQSKWFIDKIINWFGKSGIKNKVITIWGTSFKAGTDDIRESPALKVIEGLGEAGAKLRLYDPIALKNTKKYFVDASFNENLYFATSEMNSVSGANALVVCTEWLQFRNPDLEKLAQELKDKVIFDGRNLYDPEKLRLHGLNHVGIGIPLNKQRAELKAES
ncbi:MAG: UDP-glucose/GDP-mannose dehydrogenase family protein [Candidatus Melainabacteria bacterium]|nr:UDP-glucose/GDP-mannose dehydrogenase family protein [Candidatus Melainabacteria bacterium]